jgi:hypothetical protein
MREIWDDGHVREAAYRGGLRACLNSRRSRYAYDEPAAPQSRHSRSFVCRGHRRGSADHLPNSCSPAEHRLIAWLKDAEMVQRLLGISGGSTDLTHALRSWEILVRDGRSATGMALLSIAESRRSTGDPASSALQRQNTMFLPCSHWCSLLHAGQ